jgi:hypothetical protein
VTLLPARLDGPREMNRAAVQEELLGEGSLPGVRMADDREGSPGPDRVVQYGIGGHRFKSNGLVLSRSSSRRSQGQQLSAGRKINRLVLLQNRTDRSSWLLEL